MAKHPTNADGFKAVLKIIPKPALAAALELSRQAVHKWGDEVPERFAVRVSALTGLSVDVILPETYRHYKQWRDKQTTS